MKFDNIEQINEALRKGELNPLPDEIILSEVTYTLLKSSSLNFTSVLSESKSEAAVVYSVKASDRELMKEKELMEWVALSFSMHDMEIEPLVAFNTTEARHDFKMTVKEADEKKAPADNREVLGDFAEVRFTSLPSSSYVKGKVDTGATISSLHCDGHQIDRDKGQISFKCSHLSSNTITVPLLDTQAVKSSEGVTNRPVIEMTVKIGDKVIPNVKFNLNDRSTMDTPVLIGQNILTAGKYLIDPQVNEEVEMEADVDWDVIFAQSSALVEGAVEPVSDVEDGVDQMEEVDAVEADMEAERSAEMDNIYQTLRASNITFGELVEYAAMYGADEPESTDG